MDLPSSGTSRFLGENSDEFEGPSPVRVFDPNKRRQEEAEAKQAFRQLETEKKAQRKSGLQEGYDALDVPTRIDAATQAPTPKFNAGVMEMGESQLETEYPTPSGPVKTSIALDKLGKPKQQEAKRSVFEAKGPSIQANDGTLDERLTQDGIYTKYQDPSSQDGINYKRLGDYDDFLESEDPDLRQKAIFGSMKRNQASRKAVLQGIDTEKQDITGQTAELTASMKSVDGKIIFGGESLQIDQAENKLIELQKKKAGLDQQKANTEKLFQSQQAGNDLKYVRNKALQEGRNPEEDPIYLSLSKTYQTLGREVDKVDLTIPEDQKKDPIATENFYQSKGLMIEATEKARLLNASAQAVKARADMDLTDASKQHLLTTAPYERLRKQTEALIRDTNAMRDEASKTWEQTPEDERQLFVERFRGRQEAIAKASENLETMRPGAEKSAQDVNTKIKTQNESFEKKNNQLEQDFQKLNQETQLKATALEQRNVARYEEQRVQQQKKLDILNADMLAAMQSGKEQDTQAIAAKMVEQRLISQDRANETIKAFKDETAKQNKQSLPLDILATIFRSSLIASQETARGAFSIAANHLRSKLSGGEGYGPQNNLGRIIKAAGYSSLFTNPGSIMTTASEVAGNKLANMAFDNGLKTTTGKSLAQFLIDALDESATSAKENVEGIRKTIPVDEEFEGSKTGQVIKTLAEMPWMLAPYAMGLNKGMPLSTALNVSRLYSEARGDQDQSFAKQTQDFRNGKIKAEPIAMTEAEANLAALTYAMPAGIIDTIADRIGLKLFSGFFKVAENVSVRTASARLADFFGKLLKSTNSGGLPLVLAAPLGGLTESVAETSQQALLNGLASQFRNWDPNRKLGDDLVDTAIVSAIAGVLFPVVGSSVGGTYKRFVTIPQMTADNASLDMTADELRSASQDVTRGGWADFAKIVTTQTPASEPQGLAAKIDMPNSPQEQLRGNGVNWVIANGTMLDARINNLDQAISRLPPQQGKELRTQRNHLLATRIALIDALQNDAQTRTQLWTEISALSNQPLRKGEQSLQDVALIAAKLSMGAPLTEEEMKLKANGMPIIQKQGDENVISPSFMRFIAGKLPTLETVIDSNNKLFATPEATPAGAVPPRLTEAPSTDAVTQRKQGLADLVAQQTIPRQTEKNEPAALPKKEPGPQALSYTVAFSRRNGRQTTAGTMAVTASTAGQAKIEALKKLKAEGVPGKISIGPAEIDAQQPLIPKDGEPNLNSPAALARRLSPISVNEYQRRLKGNTPEEKLDDAKKRITKFSLGMKSVYGATVRLEENETTGTPAFQAKMSPEGSIAISINPARFKKMEPEQANRAVAEELFHAADFIASNLEADKAGRSDKFTFYKERRSGLYRTLKGIGQSNEQVAKAILASAALYSELENKEGGLSLDATIGLLSADPDFNDAAFMSELLRQLNSPRTTENRVEINRLPLTAAQGQMTVKDAIDSITKYLKAIYRAIMGIRSGLQATNPEVAAELDATLQSIRDVLGEQATQEPVVSGPVAKQLRDNGFTSAQISQLTPQEADRLVAAANELGPMGSPATDAPNAPNKINNLTSNNVRGTAYGKVKYDIAVVPSGRLNNMAGTELQPRNRLGDKLYEQETQSRANDLDPTKILSGNVLDTGAPTVIAGTANPYAINQTGFDIIAGHGRVASINQAPEERKQAYIAQIRILYPELGEAIDAILAAGEMPVLVRVINWDATQDASLGNPKQHLRRIARDANLGTGNSNQAEIALSDALELKDDAMLSAPPEINGELLDPLGNPIANREILDRWFKIFGSPREFISGTGFTQTFEARVRNAIVAYTFAPTNSDGTIRLDLQTFGLVDTLVSENIASEAGLLTLRSGLHKAAPSLFKVRQKFQEVQAKLPQESKDADPIRNMQTAILAYLSYRAEQTNSGRKLSDLDFETFINQGQLFGQEITPAQAMLLAPLVQRNGESGFMQFGQGLLAELAIIRNAKSIRESPERIASYLSAYANSIANAFAEYGADAPLPGMERRLTLSESAVIIRGALETAGSIYTGTKAPSPQMPDTSGMTLKARDIMVQDNINSLLAKDKVRTYGPRVKETPDTYAQAERLVAKIGAAADLSSDGIAAQRSFRLKEFLETAMLPESFEAKYQGMSPGNMRIEYLKQNPEQFRRLLSSQNRRPKKDYADLNAKDDDDLFDVPLSPDGGYGVFERDESTDLPKLKLLLGAMAYKGNVPEVTVKELVQNAFDAVKTNGGGRIDVTTDQATRTITVSDNGSGMDLNIITNGFLRLGGSIKGTKPSDTSGGLGMAKMVFLYSSELIKIDSVKNGARYTARMEGGNLKGIKILKEPTNKPNGTTITVVLPEFFTDSNGEKKSMYFPNYPDFLSQPLIGPVEVTHNGNVLPIGINQKDFRKETSFDFSWGTIELYINPNLSQYPSVDVLSAGLKQFQVGSYDLYGQSDAKLKFDILLDVRPSVTTENLAYPINLTREGWRETIREDIGALYNYIKQLAQEQELISAKNTFETLEQMPLVDLSKELTPEEIQSIRDARPRLPNPGNIQDVVRNVTISADKVSLVYASGARKTVPRAEYVPKSFKSSRTIDFSSIGIDTSKMNPKVPLFHNNTNLEYADLPQSKPLFASLGTSLLEFSREFGRKVPAGGVGRNYSDLQADGADGWYLGVSIDKKYRGLNMTKPMKAIWFNPLALSQDAMDNPSSAASETAHIFLHEITHVTQRNEGAGFTSELANNYARMQKYGVDNELLEAKLEKLYRKYWNELNELRNRFTNLDTKNNADSFQSASDYLGAETTTTDEANVGGVQEQGRTSVAGATEADREVSKDLNRTSLLSKAGRFEYEDLFSDSLKTEQENEIGATEDSARIAGEVRNIIAPAEPQKKGSSDGDRNERIRPGGKLINSFVRSAIADRFYIRGYGEDELRELAYDKIMDLLSKSPSGRAISSQYLLTNPAGTQHPEGLMQVVRDLVARAKVAGNATPTGADLMNFMTPEEQARSFTAPQVEAARAERHLFNHLLRSLSNMVAKMTGNEAEAGRVVAKAQIENRYNFLGDDADLEAVEQSVGQITETNITNIPLEELHENLSQTVQNSPVAEIMQGFIGTALSKAMRLHAQGMTYQDIADELGIKGVQRPDAKVWSLIQGGYQRMQLGLDFLQKQRNELEKNTQRTEADENKLDELNEYLSGFAKKDLAAINQKAQEKIDFQGALDAARLEKGEAVQGSLFAKAPDARVVTKYYELQNKIRAGEVTPAELDMYERIESMALKYKWPGVPVQTRLFDLARMTRRTLGRPNPQDPGTRTQMEFVLDDDTIRGLNAKEVGEMSDVELEGKLNGDWLTEEEIEQALNDEQIGQTRGLSDYGNTPNASAGIRTAQDATPRPATRDEEQTSSGASRITDEAILARIREEGAQLSDEETTAARRASNNAWNAAMDSGDETQINRAFLITRDYIRSGTEQARGLAARRGKSQEDSNRDAILMPILPTEVEVRREAGDQAINAQREVANKTAQLSDARSKLSAGDLERKDWKEWIEQTEKEIETNKGLGSLSEALEGALTKKRQKAEAALASVGTSISSLESENANYKLRTSDTMNQILAKIGDPILREAVRMHTQGLSVEDIEKALGKKGLKTQIKKAIVNGLQPEVDRRFQRLYEEVAEKGLTKKQLLARLKKLSYGQSLLARTPDQPDNELPLTNEEARQVVLDAFGLTTETLERTKSAPLFNYGDTQQVSKIASLISEAVNEPASWAKIAGDVFASFIFTGAPSLAANVGLTPLAPLTVPLHLFAEALTTQFRPNVKMAQGNDILGAPYRNIGEALQGGLAEAGAALRSIRVAAIKGAFYKGIEAFNSEMTSFGEEQGVVRQTIIERESGMSTKSIPGAIGKTIRTGLNVLLAGDEFTKHLRANMYVGAFAYRVGKAKGLVGTQLEEYIENQTADRSSLSWDLAVKRTLVDTFAQDLTKKAKKGKKFKSVGEVVGIIPEKLRDINSSLSQYADQQKFSGFNLGGRRFSPSEFVTKFMQSFLILIKSPYNLTRASAAYSPLAGLNVVARIKAGTEEVVDESTGKKTRLMQAEDYNMAVQRHSEAMIGMAGMAFLWSALEGDDDDSDKKLFSMPWMPKVLITGSSQSGPRTRYGNQATTIQIGDYSFPYGRYEPLSGLAYLADMAREIKQITKGRGNADARVINWAQDFLAYPFSKTFSKSWRDITKLATLKGAPEIVQARLASLLVPNFFRRLFEPGALTFGEEEWDAERLTGWSPTELAGWVNATLPGLPAILGKESLALPPRYKADLSVKERDVGITEAALKTLGASDKVARTAGGIARGLVPGGIAYKTPKSTRLERFAAAYNARFPQTTYNPKPPNKYIQVKDADGVSKNETLTPQEYKRMVEMAAAMTTGRVNAILTDNNIANPTQNIRKLVDSVREDATAKARESVRRARRNQSKELSGKQ